MGGIPVVKMLREALVGDRVRAALRHPQRHLQLHPDRDAETGRSFADVLAEAQPRATPRPIRPWTSAASTPRTRSPSCRRGLRRRPNYAGVEIEGIRRVDVDGHPARPRARLPHQAGRPGARDATTASCSACIPAGAARPSARRRPRARSTPSSSRAIVGRHLPGPRRGAGPTAAAVAADIADVARGRTCRPSSCRPRELADMKASPMDRHVGAYYCA